MSKKFEKHGFNVYCRDYISNREFDIILRQLREMKVDLSTGLDQDKLLELLSSINKAVESFVIKVEKDEKIIEKDIDELPASVMFSAKMYLFECFKSFAEDIEPNEVDESKKV